MKHRGIAGLLFAVALGFRAFASPLDDRIAAFSDPSATQDEAAVTALLKAGVEASRSAEALAATQPWLNRNHVVSAEALYYAATAAERSGQWLMAVGYYQRLLQTPKVDRKLADPAADAAYRLLLNAIGDENAGYLFMRKEGNTIRAYGKAKRYDRWFLDQARQRRDLIAVSQRLTTIAQDNATNPADFEDDYNWLCEQLEAFRKEEPAVYEAAHALAQAGRTPAVVKARLIWAATVMPYNQKLDELRNANAPADPKLTDAPLAAAAALLKLDPDHGAIVVAGGWGVEYDGNQSGNCAKRFNIEGQRKLEQLFAVVPKMSPDRRDDLLAYPIAQGRVRFDPAQVRDLLLKHPEMLNGLGVAEVRLFDKDRTTVEDAKALAPLLSRNPHPDAALIRAIASSGSLAYSEIVDAMMASEAWRFGETKPMIELAWRNSTVQDKGYKEVADRNAQLGERYATLLKQIDKQADSKTRLSAFNALRSDLLANSPTIPGAVALWDLLFVNAPDSDKVLMIKTLVASLDRDSELLLQRALDKSGFGDKGAGRMPWQADVHPNQFRYHRTPTQKSAGELIAHLQDVLRQQVQAGEVNRTVMGMWLHTVDPSDGSARALMQALAQSPAYAKLGPAFHAAAADSNHFGHLALSPADRASEPVHISRELLALPKMPDAQAVEAALDAVIRRASAASEPVAIHGMQPVAELKTWNDQTLRQVLSLFNENAPLDAYPDRQGYEQLLQKLCEQLIARKQWGTIEAYLPCLWRAASATDDARFYRGAAALIGLAEAALDAEATSIALALSRSGSNSRAGREIAARQDRGLPELIGRLSQVEGKSSIAIGIIDIPVDERDPSYPIYKAQSEFAIGNTASAWELYDRNAEQLMPVVRQLTVPFCLWLLERELEAEQSNRAEVLIRELTVWSRDAAGTFTPEQEGELKIAYADAAFQKGAMQTAKAWYRRVADAQEYNQTPLQYKAILRSVTVDRVSKDFGSALAELDKLMLVRDDELRMRVHYARAEVLFDQENYAEAFNEVSTVLKRDPGHADALILLGRAQLEMRKLVDASEIELGVTREQKIIVPGELIKINLSDPALNISGVGADIEVEIWTKSGDRERVMLHQLGDDKTKFRAEIPTALAERQPGDKVLQVLGRDEIRYGYSKRFREKMTDLPADPDVVITVASDAKLVASAGAFPPREGERRLDLEELGVSTAQQALGTRQVRPGNPVYLRVFDPDQSRTDDTDQLIVSIQTSNGDLIPRLILKETGPHTGEFEAVVPTGRAQALAFASESAPGRDPNMVISAKPYPGWAGAVGSEAPQQLLTIDLNDNVEPGTMTIHCDDPAQALTHFVLQTSMNGRDWVSRARFPQDPAPWIGQPQITAFPTYGRNVLAISEPEGRGVPADWLEKMEIASAAGDVSYNAFAVKGLGSLDLDLPSGGHPGYSVLIRYRAHFYQPAAAIRTFQLKGLPVGDKVSTLLLIDGMPAEASSDDALTIERELEPGLHTIEVWRHESRSELVKRKAVLLCDEQGKDELQPCPDAMFDPATFPEPVRQTLAGPTLIKQNDQTPGRIDIAFGERTRTRLVRLAIVGHEGAAPVINRITLADRQGTQRLPVKTDYQELRSNDTLEVVPGDTVSVRYEDDRVVSDRRAIQQARLSVAYNTATISASFLNYVQTDEGRELVREPIRRFKMGDAVGIIIEDPDMDQTRKQDVIKLRVRSSGGDTAIIEALETEPQSGVFVGRVFPVLSDPTREADLIVPLGGTVTASYLDEENLDPGIPTERTVTIEHAQYTTPKLAVYDVQSRPLPQAKPDKPVAPNNEDDRGPERVEPRLSLSFIYREVAADTPQPMRAVIGSSLRFDVLATHLAFAPSSEIVAYVQTESGRRAYQSAGDANAKLAESQPFNVLVPGTLKLSAAPARGAETVTPPGYADAAGASVPTNRPALDEGRFAFTVPIMLDDTPTRTYADASADALPASMIPEALAVRPGDKVYIGFAYRDADGKTRWLMSTAQLTSDALLDVMDSRYRKDIDAAYVGEKLFIRLIAPDRDRTADRDVITVNLKTRTGTEVGYQLRESEEHSGVFKGSFELSYASQPATAELPSVVLHGLPVKYGDAVTVWYPQQGSDAPTERTVAVNKGADGYIEPFSKRYGEDAVAVQTTFTLAECFFELAKHHREMEQESLARREMAHAQKLLAEAIKTHRDEDMQAHAEYLLGNLAQEYADLSKNDESRQQMYQDALARFSKIVLEYPESEFAPKAQFKKALVYEKMGELDIAVEEYVKLAYKYPDHELIPSVMSRLGSYFQATGQAYKDKAELLDGQKDDTQAQGEAIRQRELATKEFLNAARVFAKLQERFPNDPLAGLAGLRSAQNYMRAGDFDEAIRGFELVIDNEQYDDKTERSQAMFWSGISYERLGNHPEAYERYRRITFDFPDSVWAKQARGRLTDPVFAKIIEAENMERERMLEGLKNQNK